MERIIKSILNNRLIIICRKVYGDDLLRFVETIHDAGLRLLEVTFDQSDPATLEKTGAAIEMLNREFGSDMDFGAGTVLTPIQVDVAAKSGGKFIISPNVDDLVIDRTLELGLVSIPGALTPSEILHAYNRGAQFVKLFPAAAMGTGYAKDILSPINHIPLLAVGGINENNLADFLKLGFAGVGLGSCIADRKCIASGNMEEVAHRAKKLKEILKQLNL